MYKLGTTLLHQWQLLSAAFGIIELIAYLHGMILFHFNQILRRLPLTFLHWSSLRHMVYLIINYITVAVYFLLFWRLRILKDAVPTLPKYADGSQQIAAEVQVDGESHRILSVIFSLALVPFYVSYHTPLIPSVLSEHLLLGNNISICQKPSRLFIVMLCLSSQP